MEKDLLENILIEKYGKGSNGLRSKSGFGNFFANWKRL